MSDDETAAIQILKTWAAPGETLVDALDRLLNERAFLASGQAHVDFNREQLRNLRRAFAAAVLSQPNKELRISRVGIHAIDDKTEILTYEDLATFDYVYRVRQPT